MNKSHLLKALGVLGLFAMAACTGGEKKPQIALIMKAESNQFFQVMEKGAKEAAGKLDVELIAVYITKETDFEQQASKIERMVARGVDAIVIAPADSKAVVTPLLKAQRKNIPILNLDNRIDAEAATAAGIDIRVFIGPDNAEGAEKSTAYLIEKIGGRGKVAMLEGIRGVDNAEQRKAGFLRAVRKTNGAVTTATLETAEWDIDKGNKKMAGILKRFPDLAGVFCANDNMALGAIAAIDAAGLSGKIHVTAYDNIPAAQEVILEGKMAATIEQHPDKMGAMGVEYALKVIRGERIPNEIPVPTDLITAETLKKK